VTEAVVTMEIIYGAVLVGEVLKEGSSWFGGKLNVAIKKLDSLLVAADTPIVQKFLQKKLLEVKFASLQSSFSSPLTVYAFLANVYAIVGLLTTPTQCTCWTWSAMATKRSWSVNT